MPAVPALLACSVVLSAVLVAGAFHPAPHPGGDNAGYIALAYDLLANHAYTDVFDPAGAAHTKYPPVFPAVLALLMALGARTWVWFKGTAAVFTVAAVAFTFLWSERRLGAWGGFGVATLVAASSAVVYYSHWTLSDPLFLALTMASLWALDLAQERSGPPAAAARRSASGKHARASRAVGSDSVSASAEGAEDPWRDPRERPSPAESPSGGASVPRRPGGTGWLAFGVLAAGLAYFTRSAGLPLVVAVLGWLVLRGRWRALAGSAVVLGVPAAAWWLRGLGGGVASYAREFWMVNPYEPALGTIEPADLGTRALANLSAYVLRHGPGGIVGTQEAWVGVVGVVLVAAALWGWLHAVRTGRRGPSELFLPLYAGLILLWPEVWAGDRFALPLYPLLFLYAAWPLRLLADRAGGWGGLVVAAVMAVLLVPAGRAWATSATEAATCRALTRDGGPFACYGPGIAGFVEAARWAGEALPEGSAVLSRKPRHFFVQSGVPSRTFPFDADPAVQLSEADAVGARYVLLDQWDGLSGRYVAAAVTTRPGAFCHLQSFRAAQMLGIRRPAERDFRRPDEGVEVRLARCPAGYLAPDAEVDGPAGYSSASTSMRIPLLDRLDP